MTEVISIKFNSHGKTYYFDPNGINVKTGDTVIVETAKGLDIGECAIGEHYVPDDSIVPPLRPVIRIATEDDLRVTTQNKEREKEAFEICKEKIAAHGLDMKLVDVECGFEGNKILFFFTADGRVDFRDLVKDLAAVFRTRIELRQIGVRDETKMLGGLGICGRPYCCSQFLNDFQPVSTKMAKTQSMSLNPTKISGSCGRLMCCLRYEQDAYEDLIKNIPKTGALVQTPLGRGSVVQSNVLRQKVKVRLEDDSDAELKSFDASELESLSNGKPKSVNNPSYGVNIPEGAEEPEEVEKLEELEKLEERAGSSWKVPSMSADAAEVKAQNREGAGNKMSAETSVITPENVKNQPTEPKPQSADGKNRTQPAQEKKRENTGNTRDAAVGPAAQNPQNHSQNDSAAPNRAKVKQQNQNHGKKHYYNKPKEKSDNKNSAS